jgi:hypothetical protein
MLFIVAARSSFNFFHYDGGDLLAQVSTWQGVGEMGVEGTALNWNAGSVGDGVSKALWFSAAEWIMSSRDMERPFLIVGFRSAKVSPFAERKATMRQMYSCRKRAGEVG